jgi:alkanesulfonate monooxygenase SsuD/methylene tetrahydromethanopterin reductase-like flavin-dependent oxidoreductase (luciferase family)
VGWNELEYQALGQDFHARGKRMDAQIPLLRQLWTEARVRGEVGGERLDDVGLTPPALRSIPIWLGGQGPAAIRRAVAWGSGLILSGRMTEGGDDGFVAIRDRLHAAADAAGRPRAELGLEVWVATKDGTPETWRAEVERWRALGATHLSVQTYAAQPISPAEHIERVAAIADAVIVPLGAQD